jgi:hypothetical protein
MPMIVFLPKHFAEVNFNPITVPEREDDMTTDTAIERERKTTYVDVTLIEVEPEETLVFQNHSTKYPSFTLEFVGPSPAISGDKFDGDEEVRIIVAKEGDFKYKVRHYKEKGRKGHAVEAGPYGVRSCIGGCNQ